MQSSSYPSGIVELVHFGKTELVAYLDHELLNGIDRM